jgi:hypothetical protein
MITEQSEKKMMYHDVAQLSTFDTRTKDSLEIIPFVIPLEVETIRLLQENIEPQHLIEDINTMIQSRIYQKTKKIRLEYKKKDKIRHDVMQNFKAISDLMRTEPQYPTLKWQQVNRHILTVLAEADNRVTNEYGISILTCIYNATGNKPSYYDGADCSAFIQAVNDRIM